MQRHFRVSPSMMLVVVSLVVASFCLLYVMERPRKIAIGSPAGNIRVIESGFLGENRRLSPDEKPGWDKKIWDGIQVTVPEGKKWIVIVAPGEWYIYSPEGDWDPRLGAYPSVYPPLFSTGYYFRYREGAYTRTPEALPSGTYDSLELHILGRAEGGYERQVVYLVLEVDE